jgi:beta-lactam-binding protein with PASTA domain
MGGWGQVFAALDNVFRLTKKLGDWLSGRAMTEVPDVRNLPYARARQSLLDCGLRVEPFSTPDSSPLDGALVLGQDPEPGQIVRHGHRVWLRVRLD